jgi:HAD superfamily hydrolase (TIGR01509 family)
MAPGNRAAIFDLDGTLVDSMPLVLEMFAHAVEAYRERPSDDEILSKLGGPLDTCVRNLLGPSASSSLPAAVERMMRFERDHVQELLPFPGARELLGSLRSRGARLGIWSGRDRWSAQKILGEHGLAGFLDALVCGDDLKTHKPDPEGLLRTVALLGAAPEESVFMGDADVDVLGGKAAGVHTIFLHHGRPAPAHILSQAAEVFAGPKGAYAAMLRHFPEAVPPGNPPAP